MSTAKYAGLPDIDTAQDIYETPDTFTSSHQDQGNSSDEDPAMPQKGSGFRRNGAGDARVSSREELDSSPLMGADEAGKRFRRAEKRREHRQRLTYTYPPSPTSDDGASPARPPPLSQRLRALQHEVASLEAELSDPSNPLLHPESGEIVDPGILMKGLVDVRSRLEKVSKANDGRGRLVERVLKEETIPKIETPVHKQEENKVPSEPRDVAEMDSRVSELEKLVGSSGTTLDEASLPPPPLLPLITRLSNQLTLLTQPRHIDSISRRLKLLLSDLERTSTAHTSSQGRRQSQQNSQSTAVISPLQESLQPVLARLAPVLPHVPHILTRLRTLSALHTNASAFQDTLESMEEEQKRVRAALDELDGAIQTVEKSLEENTRVTTSNVSGLEIRVEELGKRMERMSH